MAGGRCATTSAVPVLGEPFPCVNGAEEFQATFGAVPPERLFGRRG